MLHRFDTYRAVDGGELLVPRSLRPDQALITEHYEEAQAIFAASA